MNGTRGLLLLVGLGQLLLSSCATTQKQYEPVLITNPRTGLTTTCDQPLNTWSLKTDAKAHLELAYDAHARVTSALTGLDSNGKLTGDISAVKEAVRIISQDSFEYMSFLYPLCKANAEGKLVDEDYAREMKRLLDKFLKENAPTVSISRTADMGAAGCVNGKRVYTNVMTDVLTFSETVQDYEAQALTNDTGGSHSVEIWYTVEGKKITPIPRQTALPFNGHRQLVKIPVHGTRLTVHYRFEQRPSRGDDEWGLSFVSSLPIAQLSATVRLPDKKEVYGLSREEKYSKANSSFSGCSFSAGATPKLECAKLPPTSPNVPIYLVWDWNVFQGC